MRYSEIIEKGVESIRQVGMADYLDLGAETRSQNRLNAAYKDSIVFKMRILGSTQADTTTELFGKRMRLPIMASAMCESRVLERVGRHIKEPGQTVVEGRPEDLPWGEDYLEEIAAGLAASGTFMSTGDVTFERLARIVDQGAPVIHVVKPYDDNEKVLAHLEKAEELGCIAVGMDIDCFFKEKAWDETPGPEYLTYKTIDEIKQFRAATSLPFLVKGVLSVEDARHAQAIGADAVMVSNHGGEAIDYTVPILKALPEVRRAVPDMVVLADSGFRRGTDVLKALALGANGVGIVTLLVIAYAAGGRDGVKYLMDALHEELQRSMSFVGCPTVASIDDTFLDFV